MAEVQSVILNLSFPQTLEDVLAKIRDDVFDIEALVASINCNLIHEWTVPKWIKPDDIVFFMHSKSSIHTIVRLRNQLKRECGNYKQSEIELITEGLNRGEDLYSKYGGKIFSYGKVVESPQYKSDIKGQHWKSRIFAYVDECCILEKPIELSDFSNFIKLSCGGSITPVFGKEFVQLRYLIASRNPISDYLAQSVAMPIPLRDINDSNWIEVTSNYRHRFLYESQFRTFYVDYLLKSLGDQRTIYTECACRKTGNNISYIDNVIRFGGRLLPVEIKLSIESEENIKSQLNKYCNLKYLCLDKKTDKLAPVDMVYSDIVLVIDTFRICIYEKKTQQLNTLISLDDIKDSKDIEMLRSKMLIVLGNRMT